MLTLHAISADEGDCLLLEAGPQDKRKFILVDGGPRETFERHLAPYLKSTVGKNGGRLALVVASHIDEDHVFGLLDLMVDLRAAADEGTAPLVKIAHLWHNSFEGTLGGRNRVPQRFSSLMQTVAATRGLSGLTETNKALLSIRQGHRLAREARFLRVPLNGRFGGKSIVASADDRWFTFAGLRMRVVGPTLDNLRKLESDWTVWLDKHESSPAALLAMSDRTVPNLSSIQLLVEETDRSKKKRRLLLTGDGRGDHLEEALAEAGLVDDHGRLFVDVLKVPHHGSQRNVDRDFFDRIAAKTYVISADGKHGNPDVETLLWIVDAARAQERKISIVVTNETPSTKELRRRREPSEFGYTLRVRDESRHAIKVSVAR